MKRYQNIIDNIVEVTRTQDLAILNAERGDVIGALEVSEDSTLVVTHVNRRSNSVPAQIVMKFKSLHSGIAPKLLGKTVGFEWVQGSELLRIDEIYRPWYQYTPRNYAEAEQSIPPLDRQELESYIPMCKCPPSVRDSNTLATTGDLMAVAVALAIPVAIAIIFGIYFIFGA